MISFRKNRLPLLLGNHWRLFGGLGVGIVLAVCLPSSLSCVFRAIVAWDSAAIIYLALILMGVAGKNTAEDLKRKAAREDQSRWMILMLMTVASFVSLIAIGTLLSNTKDLPPMVAHLHLALGLITVVSSWSMMHMIFAVHYAHEYYGDANESPDNYEAYRGLIFPGDKDPVFFDFMYYSYVVGMTCQVSDIQISSTLMRRLTLAHGVLAFFFNTVVLALTVNIAAGLVS